MKFVLLILLFTIIACTATSPYGRREFSGMYVKDFKGCSFQRVTVIILHDHHSHIAFLVITKRDTILIPRLHKTHYPNNYRGIGVDKINYFVRYLEVDTRYTSIHISGQTDILLSTRDLCNN